MLKTQFLNESWVAKFRLMVDLLEDSKANWVLKDLEANGDFEAVQRPLRHFAILMPW